jgi:hypothetical protein
VNQPEYYRCIDAVVWTTSSKADIAGGSVLISTVKAVSLTVMVAVLRDLENPFPYKQSPCFLSIAAMLQ